MTQAEPRRHRAQGDRLQQVGVPGPGADQRRSSATTSRRDGTGPVAGHPGYTQGCPSPATAKQVSGDIWYVEVDCTGHTIAPAGQSQHRMEVQFKVGVPRGRHLGTDQRPVVPGDRRAEPQGAAVRRRRPGLGRRAHLTPRTPPPHRPRHPGRVRVTPTSVTLTWPASTDTGGSGLAGYEVTAETGGSDVLVAPHHHQQPDATVAPPATEHRFWVVARDGAGNSSTASPPVAVATPAGGGRHHPADLARHPDRVGGQAPPGSP